MNEWTESVCRISAIFSLMLAVEKLHKKLADFCLYCARECWSRAVAASWASHDRSIDGSDLRLWAAQPLLAAINDGRQATLSAVKSVLEPGGHIWWSGMAHKPIASPIEIESTSVAVAPLIRASFRDVRYVISVCGSFNTNLYRSLAACPRYRKAGIFMLEKPKWRSTGRSHQIEF